MPFSDLEQVTEFITLLEQRGVVAAVLSEVVSDSGTTLRIGISGSRFLVEFDSDNKFTQIYSTT